MIDSLPYATPDFPGVGGVLREHLEDFFVQEIPLYEPSGDGEHIFFEAQKVDLTTREAVRRVAESLGINSRDVGYAGLKDRKAVTQQIFTVPATDGVDEERVMRLEIEGFAPRWAARHGNKLRVGHLAGNRFAIRIRGVNATDVVKLRPVLDQLCERGLPNYYGEQRFGRDAERPNDELGLKLLAGDFAGFLQLYLGGNDNREDVAAARKLFDDGNLAAANDAWPRNIQPEGRVLDRLVKSADPAAAVKKIDGKLRRLYENAAQSAVFNSVVAGRVDDGLLSTLVHGDVAQKHTDDLRLGGLFTVEDAAVEQLRADAWQISPTGPMPGGKMRPRPHSAAAEREAAVLREMDLTNDAFAKMPGTRRPLRVRPIDTRLSGGVDEKGQSITVAFTLPAGSFATTLLRELMKSGPKVPDA